MKKQNLVALNMIFFVAMVAVNYISNTGLIGGNTMKSISDRYKNLFTPASYAFSIWGVIYLLVLGFIIYSFTLVKKEIESEFISRVGFWFMLSCVANSLWVFAWLNDLIALSVLMMIFLLITLVNIILKVHSIERKTRFFLQWPFSLYAGWVSVALIANTAAFLTKLQWNGFGLSESAWAIIMIAVAGLLNSVIVLRKNLAAFALAGTWALLAVAMANREVHQPVFMAAIGSAVFVSICIIVNLLGKQKKGGTTR